jgi:hypothetical protein
MTQRKSAKPPRRGGRKGERLQAVYAKSRREFSAADLQKFTVNEEGIPLENVIAAMEKIQRGKKPKKG